MVIRLSYKGWISCFNASNRSVRITFYNICDRGLYWGEGNKNPKENSEILVPTIWIGSRLTIFYFPEPSQTVISQFQNVNKELIALLLYSRVKVPQILCSEKAYSLLSFSYLCVQEQLKSIKVTHDGAAAEIHIYNLNIGSNQTNWASVIWCKHKQGDNRV